MRNRKTVMITGASAGVGRATAIRFAERGDAIGLLARGRAGLLAAQRDVEAAGGKAIVLEADVADAGQVEAAADTLERTYGPIDIWVNNAMASVFSPVKETPPEEFLRVTSVTYLGVVHGTQAALKRMLPRNHGVIVQVGSALAYRGIPLQAPYCAAKHAVQGFCDSLRAELLHDNAAIHVTMVQLPALNTPQFDWVKSRLRGRGQPVPPIFQPEVAADAIVWASESRRREVYVGMPTVMAIVGNKLFPGVGDRYLARTGYAAQQTDEPDDPDRPHNLWAPVDRDCDFGARGRFDERSRTTSWQLTLSRNRGWFAGAAAAAIVAAAWAAARLAGTRPGPRQRLSRSRRTPGSVARISNTPGSHAPATS
jgi:NAD(P)-dependent dehydrogenase (short-subunit alcohol dehydrogenase family)